MAICHDHNLNNATTGKTERYGIRITLPSTDPLNNLLDENWETIHWFETEAERDRVLADMAAKHLYSRIGDRPSLVYEKVTRE